MVSIVAEIQDETLRAGLKELSRSFSPEFLVDDVELVAEEVLRRAIDSPIPSDTRGLANTATTVKRKDEVRFGFNKVYAHFQDALNRTQPWIIVPRVKKILYIPISTKGRLHRHGNNPIDEGLERGKDFVLAPRAVIPIKPYGSAIGPNQYFSETVKRNVTFMFFAISSRAEKRLGRVFQPSKKKLSGRPRGGQT